MEISGPSTMVLTLHIQKLFSALVKIISVYTVMPYCAH